MAKYKTTVILEIARGDSIEQLLNTGVIRARTFYAADGSPIEGYGVVGGTQVEAEIDGNRIRFDKYQALKNAYGFGHGQRPIMKQARSGCWIISEVFIGQVDAQGYVSPASA